MPNPHEREPLQAHEVPPDLRAKLEALLESDYMDSVRPLRDLVAGRTVVGSSAGHSGFIVELDNATFVVAYLDQDRLLWKHGSGIPSAVDFSLMASPAYADASAPVEQDRPYASEFCDVAREVTKTQGQLISGLAIGEATFNLAFADGHELDTMLVTMKDGRRGLRVFWEQW